jgi:hypothetical protein
MRLEEIYKKAEHFDEHFAKLIPVTLPIMDEYEGKIRDVVTKHVHAFKTRKPTFATSSTKSRKTNGWSASVFDNERGDLPHIWGILFA